MDAKSIKNVFIDSNIWLSLFHYTNVDLEQFSKLKDILDKEIRLFIPEQVYNEIYRNRENKLKDALERFEKFDLQFPVFFKNYPEYSDFSKKLAELKTQHKEWLKKVKEDIANQTSPADGVIKGFFASVCMIPLTDDIIRRGVLRYDMGNPPGKDKKYGDAINWETLLQYVPDGEDLFFISNDKDYASIYNDKEFNPFLSQEWNKKKNSKIIFFKSLNDFLKEHFNDIKLQAEGKKEDLIEQLSKSGSFKTTHAVIGNLSEYTDWSFRQIQDMCNIAFNNHNVGWILGDTDVFEFYTSILQSDEAKSTTDEAISNVKEEIERIKYQNND